MDITRAISEKRKQITSAEGRREALCARERRLRSDMSTQYKEGREREDPTFTLFSLKRWEGRVSGGGELTEHLFPASVIYCYTKGRRTVAQCRKRMGRVFTAIVCRTHN